MGVASTEEADDRLVKASSEATCFTAPAFRYLHCRCFVYNVYFVEGTLFTMSQEGERLVKAFPSSELPKGFLYRSKH